MRARFKDLCLDAADPQVSGTFWARVLGGDLVDLGDGDTRVDDPGGPGPASIWVNRVPEPRTVKTRVHLELRMAGADPAELVAAGARVVRAPDREIEWWVLADPDGNEFCVFAAGPDTSPGPMELVVDAAQPERLARWWAGVLGGDVEITGWDAASLIGAAGFPFDEWIFNPVPEGKTVKNRMHWDVDLDEPEPSALVRAGATLLREPDDAVRWWVLADPEGNEFCVFTPGPTQ
ncbi:VOC family protein [Micromonospora sp. WMMD812]|uniref:VOC family protein n=1 Tax=Micromonospora sp. WMMD812 TaxID=3015152 RepID=UPI00248B5A61|nr:VOC family protein [Micromonospora sp. WMMD812]WBB67540.1 VOC family protein [Micromonospora sp. WMMD812]